MYLLQQAYVCLKQCVREMFNLLSTAHVILVSSITITIPNEAIAIPVAAIVIPSAVEESCCPGSKDSSATLGMTTMLAMKKYMFK